MCYCQDKALVTLLNRDTFCPRYFDPIKRRFQLTMKFALVSMNRNNSIPGDLFQIKRLSRLSGVDLIYNNTNYCGVQCSRGDSVERSSVYKAFTKVHV